MENSGARKKSWNKNNNQNVYNKNASQKPFQNYQTNNQQVSNKRRVLIGIRELQDLLQCEPHIILVTLLSDSSGYRELLGESNIEKNVLCLIIKVIHKSLDSKIFSNGTKDILLLTFSKYKFLVNLNQFISDAKYEIGFLNDYLPLICNIIDEYFNLSPVNAFPVASGFIDLCVGIIQHVKRENKSFESKFEQSLQILQLKIKENRKDYVKSKSISSEALPDDFRELDVVPTGTELNATTRPFIRPNIIDGSYENVDHYLDIQFRLLKEDFMRPLREGLKHYLTGFSKNSDVRVYFNLTLHSTSIENTDIVHYFLINKKRNFFFDSSKRFMFGNIICISGDNFNTVITASVFNTDKLSDNLVGVKIETELACIHYNKQYVAIESKAYFVSYKHTLRALQNLENIPFESYIVFVKEENKKPQYVFEYLFKDVMKKSYAAHVKGKQDSDIELSNPSIHNINIALQQSTLSKLNMDESQVRALHAALNRQVAIIQGPPGTGKTFLGLKITKLLLQFKTLWNKNQSHPILVVCYTNHALDQFLEGMTTFTDKIIRVGSRSKSEVLRKFDIKHCIFEEKEKKDEDPVSKMYHENRIEIRNCKTRLNILEEVVSNLSDLSIVDLSSFNKDFNILPDHVMNSLKNLDMERFLREKYIPKNTNASKSEEIFSKESQISKMEHVISPQEELTKQEENERMIDDEDEDYDDDYDISKEVNMGDNKLPYFKILVSRPQLQKQRKEVHFINNNTFSEKKKMDDEIKIKLEMLNKIHDVNLTDKEQECRTLEELYISELTFDQRAKLYCYWHNKLRVEYEKLKKETEKDFMNLNERLLSLRQLAYLTQMKKVDVVGMTTTGAARYCDLLHDLAPPIVIVEEAAEILEAHVISSLSSKCQHIIMIGDHQQLRPKPAVYELCKKYNLDTSLFERLIKNGINYETLEYQHRMKPIISDLLVPTFYENLKDHPSVFEYPKIKGLEKDLFFVNHNLFEQQPSEDNESFENLHEAKFLIGLCRHLVYQGYTEEDITVITPYSGQFRCLRELQKKEKLIQNIPISILDNFQGEESNIILLSLVRSNEEENVGFMKIDNRICVAISRAKHGMYIIGNMNQMIKSSSIWSKINEKLVNKNSIGFNLHLFCKNHPELSITVNSYEEFALESPEGGCKQKCSTVFSKCGHVCPRFCHPDDPDHTKINCIVSCSKFLCEFNHTPCKNLCYEDCPKCVVPVEKKFACGHKHKLKCCINPDDTKCTTIKDKILPCNHLAKHVKCSDDLSDYICRKQCLKVLSCGHNCKKRCHNPKLKKDQLLFNSTSLKDSDACPLDCKELVERELVCGHKHNIVCRQNLLEFKCPTITEKILPCEHTAKNVPCHISVLKYICKEKCLKTLNCGHKFETECNIDLKTIKCPTLVDQILSCEHKVKIKCHIDIQSFKCQELCSDLLECGHSCDDLCHHITNPSHENKICKKEIEWKLGCGHILKDICSSSKERKCKAKCQLILPCGHPCSKYCGEACGECRKLVSKVNLKCGHTVYNVECCTPDTEVKCKEECKKILSCNHPCPKLCGEICGKCVVAVEKTIQKCLHTVVMPCSSKPNIKQCTNACQKKLQCGHQCQKKCRDPCYKKCLMEVATNVKCARGHFRKISCHDLRHNSNKIDLQGYSLLSDYTLDRCTEVCGLILECNHPCKGQCGDCLSGRIHVPCASVCDKRLPCGHRCKAACADECPPCQENCLMKCPHTTCKKKCGERCSPTCKEKCVRTCEHSTCSAVCGIECTRKPCNYPCNKRLEKCSHPCIGLCGEPCSNMCKYCDEDDLQKILLGDITLEKARFVMLEDCEHVFEVDYLDKWMKINPSKDDTNQCSQMKLCPRCSTPIYNTRRYRTLIKDLYCIISTQKIGQKSIINHQWFRKELLDLLPIMANEVSILKENLGFDQQFSVTKKYMNASLLDLYCFQVKFLKFASRTDKNFNHYDELNLLVYIAMNYKGIITSEKTDQFFCELRRLRSCDMLENMNKNGVKGIVKRMEELMHPTNVFSKSIENQVRNLMKQAYQTIKENKARQRQNRSYNSYSTQRGNFRRNKY